MLHTPARPTRSLRRTAVDNDHPPISTADAKAALRITHSFEDAVLERKLLAAEELVAERTTRILRPTDFELTIDLAGDAPFWAGHALDLGVYPVRDLTSIEIRDALGAWAVVPAEHAELNLTPTGGLAWLLSSASLPAAGLASGRSNLRIRFSAGYGDAGEGVDADPELVVPARAIELVLLLAGHWFEHREAVTSGDLAEIPLGAELLFEDLRIFR